MLSKTSRLLVTRPEGSLVTKKPLLGEAALARLGGVIIRGRGRRGGDVSEVIRAGGIDGVDSAVPKRDANWCYAPVDIPKEG